MSAERLPDTAGAGAPVSKEQPWPGPAPYTERASAFFFGREQEADDLFRLVRSSGVSVLYGASGLGKTSLLCAGLFPRLREEDFLPIYIRLKGETGTGRGTVTIGGLSRQALKVIALEAKGRNISFPDRQSLTDNALWEYLCHVETELWGPHNEYLTPVLIFDQFEEMLRGGADKSLLAAFMQELGDLIEGRVPVSVREKVVF